MVVPIAPDAFFSVCNLPDFVDTTSDVQRSVFIEITPELAEALLKHNDNNRNLRQSVVRKLVADILQGNFVASHQGIAFYEDGSLADGQHRLNAIIEAGRPVVMLVTIGLERLTGAYIDMGAKRTESDALRIADSQLAWANSRAFAIINVLRIEFPELYLITSADKASYLKKYEDSFRFVMAKYSCNMRGLKLAGISAAFVAAHIAGCSEQKLASAADLLACGLSHDPTDVCANTMIVLRNHLLRRLSGHSGNAANHEAMYVTGSALRKYFDGKVVSRINVPDKFSFPVYDVSGSCI